MDCKSYPAQVLVTQEVLGSIDRAIKEVGIGEASFLDSYFNGDAYPTIDTELSEDQLRELLGSLPLAATTSRFVPADVIALVLRLSTAFEGDCAEPRADYQALADNLEQHRHVLSAFYCEALRMWQQQGRCSFADNLVIEVADVVLRSLPLILAYAEEDTQTAALNATVAASEVRAQVAWGLVRNFNSFRVDVIMLAVSLQSLETFLGNDTSQPLPRLENIDWRSKMLVMQAAHMLQV